MGSTDPLIAFDQNFTIKFINQSGSEFFGRAASELVGKRVENCGIRGSLVASGLTQALRSKVRVSCEHEIPDEKGARFFQGNYSPILDSNEDVGGIFCILTEVTDRRTLLRHLAVTNKRLETQAKALEVFEIVSESDLFGNILYANDRFCEVSRYSRSEIIGKNYRILNSGYHSKVVIQNLWKTISEGGVWIGKLKNKAKDGSYFWVQTIIAPLHDREGKFSKFLSIQRDITKEQSKDEQAFDDSFRYHQIFMSSPLKLVSLDLEGNIVFGNQNLAKGTSATIEELIGKNWLDIFVSPDQRPAVQIEFMNLSAKKTKSISFQTQMNTPDGTVTSVNWLGFTIYSPTHYAMGFHLYGEAENEMNDRGLWYQHLNEKNGGGQKNVVSFVSHELRGGIVAVESGLRYVRDQLAQSHFSKNDLDLTLEKVLKRVSHLEAMSTNRFK